MTESATLRERLDALAREMVERGIRFEDAVAEFEILFIAAVLERHKGNVSTAATELGMHRNTLGKRLRALDVKNRSRRGRARKAPADA